MKKLTKKMQKEKLFQELHNAKEEKDYLEYDVIPTIISELKHLKLTKKEVEETGIDKYYEWND